MLTEGRNPKTERIDEADTLDILRTINDEDQTVALVVRKALPVIAQAVDAITAAFARGGRLIYVGAGTSGRLGVLDAVECVPTYSIDPVQVQGVLAGGIDAMTRSIEGAEDQRDLGAADLRARNITSADVVVGIAASGTTPYVIGALDYANGLGAVTVGISCNVPAPLLDVAQIKIGLPVGAEVISGSTRMKAGTAQKLVLNMLSTAAMIRSGKVYGNLMVDVQVVNDKLVRRARRIVREVTGVDEATAADLLVRAGNNAKVAIVMQQRGVDQAAARELLRGADGHLRRVIG
ncbi:MAG: N-acetylmuramic acid 6-phosphate etherase [Anaerolinea sp.]|nr:N-acetylmuramic acid 6-phosphate etherase [Anaerolinea sp.]